MRQPETGYYELTHGVEISVDDGDVSVRVRLIGTDTRSIVFDEAMDVRDALDRAVAVACRNIAPEAD